MAAVHSSSSILFTCKNTALWMSMSVCWSLHHFAPHWNILHLLKGLPWFKFFNLFFYRPSLFLEDEVFWLWCPHFTSSTMRLTFFISLVKLFVMNILIYTCMSSPGWNKIIVVILSSLHGRPDCPHHQVFWYHHSPSASSRNTR